MKDSRFFSVLRYTVFTLAVLGLSLLLLLWAPWSNREDARCSALLELSLEQAKVTAVESKAAGYYTSMKLLIMTQSPFIKMPASCRVHLTLKPSADSDIRAEVWLPAQSWNGKMQAIGNGGLGGSVDEMLLAFLMQRNYAAYSSDTGHEASDMDGRWALGHPEKIKDFYSRALHEITLKAKVLVQHYYGKPAKNSYYASCSNGGRMALKAAQLYPEDYDGIIAGAPAYDGSNTVTAFAWNQHQLLDTPGAYIPSAKLPAIAAAVVSACDALDGVADGVLEDPRQCHFDPYSLLCQGGDNDKCLSKQQARALRQIYAGPGGGLGSSQDHGFEPGGELGMLGKNAWKNWVTGNEPGASSEYEYATEFFRNLIYGDASWTLARFNYKQDRQIAQERMAGYDARDPDLSRFKARGGKLLMYHGWADAALQPRLAIDYYENVRKTLGVTDTNDFMRLYMVPGMQHCIGGPGPNTFDQFLMPAEGADATHSMSAALQAWVENGHAPDTLIASKYNNDYRAQFIPKGARLIRTRPLCPYPKIAHWSGQGSTDVADNFFCVDPT